jgi:phosphate acetyltransferase
MAQGIAVATGRGKCDQLLERCEKLEAVSTAVVHSCEGTALSGAIEAAEKGLIVPILIGPRGKIEATAKAVGINLTS